MTAQLNTYDVDPLRARFPALASGVAHFDGPGGSQVPDVVADAIRTTLVAGVSNRGRMTAAERYADASWCWRPGRRWRTCSAPTPAGSSSAAA